MNECCQECIRRDREIQRLRLEATTLRQAKLQGEEQLPVDPTEWLLGFESDQAITDQLRAIGRAVARLQREQVRHAAKGHDLR